MNDYYISKSKVESVINKADIVDGYAFTKFDLGYQVIDLHDPRNVITISNKGEVLETNMDNIQMEIVLKSCKKVIANNINKPICKYSASDIVCWFVWRNEFESEDIESISFYKIVRLLYYAEGCSLALLGKSIFSEKIVATGSGPCIREICDKYEASIADDGYSLHYCEDTMLGSVVKISKDKEISNLLEKVYLFFGLYSAWGAKG